LEIDISVSEIGISVSEIGTSVSEIVISDLEIGISVSEINLFPSMPALKSCKYQRFNCLLLCSLRKCRICLAHLRIAQNNRGTAQKR